MNLLLSAQALTLASSIMFSANDISSWSEHVFTTASSYKVITVNENTVLDARCEPGQASGLFYRDGIDLEATPWVRWTWRVLTTPTGNDEKTKAGDDFALRIYAIDEHNILRWRTRALNYVWARNANVLDDWPNPFAKQAHMLALQSGVDSEYAWHTEVRNLQEDFKKFHSRELSDLSALAIMTDCDNTESSAHGQLLEISLHAEKPDH